MRACRYLVLVRHGESELNARNRSGHAILCGQFDTPLTAVGRRQAQQVGAALAVRADLAIRHAVSSALSRARDTLDAIIERLPPPVERCGAAPELNERSLGVFEGRTLDEIQREYPQYVSDPGWNRFRDDFEQRAPGGENLTQVAERACGYLEALWRGTTDDVLVVSHAMTIRCLVGRATRLSPGEWLETAVAHDRPIFLRAPLGAREFHFLRD